MEKYWLVINSDTFIWSGGNLFLFYDTANKKSVKIKSTSLWSRLYRELMRPESLYCVEVTNEDLADLSFSESLALLEKERICKLLNQKEVKLKPVSFLPLLGIQRSREKFLKDHRILEYENAYSYLQEAVIYINGDPAVSSGVYKQFPYFLSGNKEIDFLLLRPFLEELRISTVSRIKIAGRHVLEYTNFGELLNCLDLLHSQKEFYVSSSELMSRKDLISLAGNEQFHWKIIVDKAHPLLEELPFLLEKYSSQVEWLFYVSTIDDCEEAEAQIQKCQIEKYRVQPIFTGTNLDFFEQYVFIDENDIQSQPILSKQHIFMNQAINISDYGLLTLFPDGNVYANVNKPVLGNLERDNITELVFQELLYGASWLRVRNETPCSDCLYQWLCQSPSNYELVIGRNNLCHIK